MPGLHELKPAKGARKDRRRRGIGDSAGQGSYSGRGGKGQRKRESVRPQFEGGQLPIVKRLPYMRGFHNPFRVSYTPVNLDRLNGFDAGSEVTPEVLRQAGVIKGHDARVKVLGGGKVTRALKVTVHAASQSARRKIAAAGGSITVLTPPAAPETERAESTAEPGAPAKVKRKAPKK
jgi:large subunit ribosomal protein L15